jgi:hypothetical protein
LGFALLRGKIHAPFWTFQGLKSVLETPKNTRFFGAKARPSWLVTGFLCWRPDLEGLAKEGGGLTNRRKRFIGGHGVRKKYFSVWLISHQTKGKH